MLRFGRMHCLQKFAPVHSFVHNHFNLERQLYSRNNFKLNRTTALADWRQLCSVWVHSFCGNLRRVRIRLTAPRIEQLGLIDEATGPVLEYRY